MKELFDLIWSMNLKTLFDSVGVVLAVCLLLFDPFTDTNNN